HNEIHVSRREDYGVGEQSRSDHLAPARDARQRGHCRGSCFAGRVENETSHEALGRFALPSSARGSEVHVGALSCLAPHPARPAVASPPPCSPFFLCS